MTNVYITDSDIRLLESIHKELDKIGIDNIYLLQDLESLIRDFKSEVESE